MSRAILLDQPRVGVAEIGQGLASARKRGDGIVELRENEDWGSERVGGQGKRAVVIRLRFVGPEMAKGERVELLAYPTRVAGEGAEHV